MCNRICLLGSLLLISLASCTPPSGDTGGSGNGGGGNGGTGRLNGELVYFSGRPAPEWTIPESEHAGIAQRLEDLTPATQPEQFPRFGPVAYRVINESGIEGIPVQVLVQGGIIQVETLTSYSYFSDDNGLEAALKASSQSAGAYAELGLDE